jgi:hypothetical protein
LVSGISAGKNPVKVRAGRLGAERRWANHVPDSVRIADLSPEQQRLVLALIQAARDEGAGKAAG